VTVPSPPEGFINVRCVCDGYNPQCQKCAGSGWQAKRVCPGCQGVKIPGYKCPDCRGVGWRELDNGFDRLYGRAEPGGW
jgi:hypothetical protein